MHSGGDALLQADRNSGGEDFATLVRFTGAFTGDDLGGLAQGPEQVGTAADETVTGSSNDDRLFGADQMTAGAGDDVFIVNILSDVVTKITGEDIDTVRTATGSKMMIMQLYVLPPMLNG